MKIPAKNVDSLAMTEDTVYVLTGTVIVNGLTGQISYSRSPNEGKIYAIKCRNTQSIGSVKVRL